MSIQEITLIGDYVNGAVGLVCGAWVFTSLMRTFFGKK